MAVTQLCSRLTFGIHCLLLWLLAQGESPEESRNFQDFGSEYTPPDFLSPLELYPNLLNITDIDRRNFHPVVKFPHVWAEDSLGKLKRIPNYQVLDLRTASAVNELASEDERHESRQRRRRTSRQRLKGFHVGRYDENRINLYASDMFDDTSHQIDGYGGKRTVHIGIDLDGPLYTKVYSFTKGVVHSVGYNPELGDYGNVIVIEHDLGNFPNGTERRIWALYGHLDDNSSVRMRTGKRVNRGQCIGRMGDLHENGGWRVTHVHFQLSILPPETHDMPGVVTVDDRRRALLQYPDPRLVLGSLY